MSEYDYENDPDIAIAPPKKTIVKEKPLASTGVDSAANYNNPTGYGWNKKNRTWAKYNTPEEGINDSLNRIGGYLSNQGPMSNVVSTPENYVGMWVNGDPKTGSSVQGGSYVKKIRTELANAGIELNKNGSIPNTEQARKAILKAHIVQENAPEHQNKFLKVLNTNVSPEDKYDYENDPDILFTPSKQNIEEKPYQPGYYNPNLVQQGENARLAGGGNLQPIVGGVDKALKSMSVEDWKKESLIANMLKYGVGSMPIVGDEAMREEGRQKLLQTGGAALHALTHPIETAKNISEAEPGEFIGNMIKGGIYDLPLAGATRPIEMAASAVGKPVLSATGKAVSATSKAIAPAVKTAEELREMFKNARAGVTTGLPEAEVTVGDITSDIPKHIVKEVDVPRTVGDLTDAEFEEWRKDNNKDFGTTKGFRLVENPEHPDFGGKPMSGVGAANVTKESSINALLPELSPETQNIVKNTSPDKINLPALETKALEEKHGISLSKGQRSDPSRYADEWNRRGTDESIQGLFANQPQQFAQAFDNLLDKHAPDIGELTKENIGQLQINALANKDKLRISDINKAKQDLVDANGGQFPIDIGKLKENINTQLGTQYKSRYLSDAIKGDLEDFYKNPTFEAYEHVRSNLADEMRTAKDGKSRQAAWIARNEMEKLPIFGEEAGSPQAIALKALADKYRSLNVERYNVLETNPAYKAAVKEATDVAEAESIESLNAAKFHDKYVTNATPEATRRMIEEIQDIPKAMQAIKAGDILNAKEAAGLNGGKLNPASLNKYLRTQTDKNKFIHSPESAQDLLDLEILSGKVAQPKERVFNYSNSTSALLGELAKQGLQFKGEAALAAVTKGVSIPVVGAGKQILEQFNKRKFAQETTNPHSGIIQEK